MSKALLNKISSHPAKREFLKEILSTDDSVMVQDLDVILKSFPEHADLLLFSPAHLFQHGLEVSAEFLPGKILELLFSENRHEPTEKLFLGLCRRFRTDPDFSARLLIRLKLDGGSFTHLTEEVASSKVFLRHMMAALKGRYLKTAVFEILQIIKKESIKETLQSLLSEELGSEDIDLARGLKFENLKSVALKIELLLEKGQSAKAKELYFQALEDNLIFDLELFERLKVSAKEASSLCFKLIKSKKLGRVLEIMEKVDFEPEETLLDSVLKCSSLADYFFKEDLVKTANRLLKQALKTKLKKNHLFLLSLKGLSPENVLKGKELALKSKNLASGSVVEFIERNADDFTDEELESLRKKYELGNAYHSVLRFCTDPFLRESALRLVLRDSFQSAEVFNDLNVKLSPEELNFLIKKGQDHLSLFSLLERTHRGEIQIKAVPARFVDKIRLAMILRDLRDSHTLRAAEEIKFLSNEATLTLLNNIDDFEKMIFAKKEIFEAFSQKDDFKSQFFKIAISRMGKSFVLRLSDQEVMDMAKASGLSPEAALILKENHRLNFALLDFIEFSNPVAIESFFSRLDEKGQDKVLNLVFKIEDLKERDSILGLLFLKNKKRILEAYLKQSKARLPYEIEAETLADKSLVFLLKDRLDLFSSESLVAAAGIVLHLEYSTDLAKKALLLFLRNDISVLDGMPFPVLKSLLTDENLRAREKEFVLARLSPEVLEKLSIAYGPPIERKRLLSLNFWPTSSITKVQLEILSLLDPKNGEDHKIKELFLESLKLSELPISADILDALPGHLYSACVSELEQLSAMNGHISEATLLAFLNSKQKQKPEFLYRDVVAFGLDWMLLDEAERVKAIEYGVEAHFESFQAKKDGENKAVFLSNRPVLLFVDGQFSLRGVKTLSAEALRLLKKLLTVSQGLPKLVLGDFHLKDKSFIPHDSKFPLNDVKLDIEISPQALQTLKQVSPSAVLKGVRAQKVLDHSIVYCLEIDQAHVFEILSENEEILKEAKELYDSIKRLKKNSRQFLDSLKLISTDQDRTFGLEVELVSSIKRATLAKKLGKKAEATNEYSSHMSWPKWTVKFDSSINAKSDDFKAELVSPILQGQSGLKEVKSVLLKLNSLMSSPRVKFEVGEKTRTGLHVHHSIQDLIERVGEIEEGSKAALKMGRYIMGIQGALYALCSRWRLSGVHSRPLREPGEIAAENGRHGFAVSEYGTLEFRLKEATLNVEAIMRWITLTQHVTISLIERMNNDLKASKKHLEKALDQGLSMILSEDSEKLGRSDVVSHLAYYQLAQKYALSA